MKGHLEERSPGVWRLFYDLGADPVTGRRRLRSRTFRGDRRGAERQLAIVVGEAAAGVLPDPRGVTVAQFADRWLQLVEGSVRPTTLESYRQKLKLASTLIGERRLARLSGDLLTELYRTLPRSPQTVVHVHRVLHRMLADAVRWGWLSSNPAGLAVTPKLRRAPIRTWTASDVARFLEHTENCRLAALYRLAVSTGMRRGELCGLQWRNVQLESGALKVEGCLVMVAGRPFLEEPKTRAGRRIIALDPHTVQALEQLHQAQDRDQAFFGWEEQWVFCWEDGRPYSPDWVTRRFAQDAARAGLPHIRFHDLRHTWATLALEAGVPAKVVADRLGHAGIAITLDTYTHHVDALDRDAAVRVAALFGNRFGNTRDTGTNPP